MEKPLNEVLATYKDQQLSSDSNLATNRYNRPEQAYETTVFFTDRSLYRPGQTIHYKGIALRVDHQADDYKVLPDRTLTVVFADANGKEVERRAHRTNDYGSFSGSFTAPRDRLPGAMNIHVDGGPGGAAGFQVEEYKRPKFQATLDAPKTAAKLAAKVEMTGKATAYTGAAIGGAKVRYRVVREVRYPDWWRWCFWWRVPQTASQEIAHGTTTTAADGGFSLQFVAKPDPAVEEKDEPIFAFSVSADVTDSSGETRSAARIVNIGYTALRAALAAPEWLAAQKPFELTLSAQTLNGDGQRAEGSLTVYQLKQPEAVQRPSLFTPQPSPPKLRRKHCVALAPRQ